ncbi:hypothetical protein F5J12DRAFT_80619 [Pisolithus orientalis]|uniref:uncharacterized protein n=1 Tax=Pisolithus orientalis TaxID=936130 RepID=UPI0022250256|nr:uncharacterized protein F5J12DRAFT_80619 [Pisolithus orientalis]KAI6007562.1 hypothetical protein F5J12DRAFT_80619 [Pisolithus orientalis]
MTTDEVSKHKRPDVNFCAPRHGSTYQCRALHQESGAGSASVSSWADTRSKVYEYICTSIMLLFEMGGCSCILVHAPVHTYAIPEFFPRCPDSCTRQRDESSSALSRYLIVARSGHFVANLRKFRNISLTRQPSVKPICISFPGPLHLAHPCHGTAPFYILCNTCMGVLLSCISRLVLIVTKLSASADRRNHPQRRLP